MWLKVQNCRDKGLDPFSEGLGVNLPPPTPSCSTSNPLDGVLLAKEKGPQKVFRFPFGWRETKLLKLLPPTEGIGGRAAKKLTE